MSYLLQTLIGHDFVGYVLEKSVRKFTSIVFFTRGLTGALMFMYWLCEYIVDVLCLCEGDVVKKAYLKLV